MLVIVRFPLGLPDRRAFQVDAARPVRDIAAASGGIAIRVITIHSMTMIVQATSATTGASNGLGCMTKPSRRSPERVVRQIVTLGNRLRSVTVDRHGIALERRALSRPRVEHVPAGIDVQLDALGSADAGIWSTISFEPKNGQDRSSQPWTIITAILGSLRDRLPQFGHRRVLRRRGSRPCSPS